VKYKILTRKNWRRGRIEGPENRGERQAGSERKLEVK
jgi:hypothetical protein